MKRILLVVAALALAPSPGRADGFLRVTMDAVSMLSLDGEAGTVFLANPAVVDVTATAADRLLILGRQPGESGLVVLDPKGGELYRGTVIVAPRDAGVVTVNRGGAEVTLNCTPRCSTAPAAGAAVPEAPPPAAPAPTADPGS